MTTGEEVLRRLSIGDPNFYRALVSAELHEPLQGLDARSVALVQLGGVISTGAAGPVWQQYVHNARLAGLSLDEVVGALAAMAPAIGFARTVSAAPDLAHALGYDIDEALERLDEPARSPAAEGH